MEIVVVASATELAPPDLIYSEELQSHCCSTVKRTSIPNPRFQVQSVGDVPIGEVLPLHAVAPEAPVMGSAEHVLDEDTYWLQVKGEGLCRAEDLAVREGRWHATLKGLPQARSLRLWVGRSQVNPGCGFHTGVGAWAECRRGPAGYRCTRKEGGA